MLCISPFFPNTPAQGKVAEFNPSFKTLLKVNYKDQKQLLVGILQKLFWKIGKSHERTHEKVVLQESYRPANCDLTKKGHGCFLGNFSSVFRTSMNGCFQKIEENIFKLFKANNKSSRI